MKRTILPCTKCKTLVNVKLPKFASGYYKGIRGSFTTVSGRNLSREQFHGIFVCMKCGGKYN